MNEKSGGRTPRGRLSAEEGAETSHAVSNLQYRSTVGSKPTNNDTLLDDDGEEDEKGGALDQLGLLKDGRGITLIVVVINMFIQVGVFLLHLNDIINNYYLDYREKNPGDYILHHLLFFIFVVFESITVGIALWISVHGTTAGLRWILRKLYSVPSPSSPPSTLFLSDITSGAASRSDPESGIRTLPRRNKAKEERKGANGTTTATSSVTSIAKRIWKGVVKHPEALLIGLAETVLFAVCVLEAKLLADMAVHFIDLDLVDAMGLKTVLQRQQSLGAGIAEEHWRYIHLIIVLLFTLQFGIYMLARFIESKLSPSRIAKLFIVLVLLSLVLFAIAPNHHKLLVHRQGHFRSLLPFNFFDAKANQELIPVTPKTTLNFPPRPGEGYPVLDEERTNRHIIPRIVGKRRNIVVLVQESFRRTESILNSPKTQQFAKEHHCIQPQMNVAGGHVTELSWFAILYGLYSYHYHDYSTGHVRSFPLEMLKENDYVTALITASICWPYPNRNIFTNFQELHSEQNNLEVFGAIDKFIAQRKEDKKNFFLYLTLHKSYEEYTNDPRYNFEDKNDFWELKNKTLLRDRDRVAAIEQLNNSGLLEDAMLFILSDHGDMRGEHGEQGHGQKEGSWWNEKAWVPFWACFLGQNEMDNFHPTPQLSSLVDVSHTWMNQLKWDPPVDTRAFMDGMSVAIPKSEADWTKDRFVVTSARYFPRKDKINAIIDKDVKLWFRVTSFDHASKRMEFFPERLTDTNDKNIDTCDLLALKEKLKKMQYTFEKGGIVAMGGEGMEEEGRLDPCQTALLFEKLQRFGQDFWRFFGLQNNV